MAPATAFVSAPVRGPAPSARLSAVSPAHALPTAPVHARVTTSRLHAPRASVAVAPAPLPPALSIAPPGAPARAPRRIALCMDGALRVEDNPALRAAVEGAAQPGGALVPFVLAGRNGAAEAAASSAAAALAQRGSGLLRVEGGADGVVQLCRRLRLDAVYVTRAVGAATVRGQAALLRRLRGADLHVRAYWGGVLGGPPADADLCAEDGGVAAARRAADAAAGPAKGAEAVMEPEEAPGRLPKLPSAASSARGVVMVEPCEEEKGRAREAEQVLRRMDRQTETKVGRGRADVSMQLLPFLDEGVLSPRMVAKHIGKVVGKMAGVTYAELVWRDYVSLAAHRGVGLRSAETVVLA